MRMITALIALSIAPIAAADEAPCQDAATYTARRCTQAVTEAFAIAEESRATLDSLAWCSDTKKKKELMQCVADMTEATRKLGRASRILKAAAQSDAALPAE